MTTETKPNSIWVDVQARRKNAPGLFTRDVSLNFRFDTIFSCDDEIKAQAADALLSLLDRNKIELAQWEITHIYDERDWRRAERQRDMYSHSREHDEGYY